ncbi:P-loop NTPase family protein [Terriglobus tenax]|uniref:hypothetical protein n=1 Tax=Terriglobus tenax TaxID=1111115 RepID=UPI0021DFD281|nr:hypothetical protein [Terriglobus tenax]
MPSGPRKLDERLAMACDGLVDQLFVQRQATANLPRGLVIAITAPHSGAGVTYITEMLAERLGETAARVQASALEEGTGLPLSEDFQKSIEKMDRLNRRSEVLYELRANFHYVLVDCPSVKDGHFVTGLAPLVDGVIIVIEADRTQKRQILYTERTIQAAGGNIFGHILNKRNYPVPGWIFRRLEAMGV